MIKVELINYTSDALEMLLFTKDTRLKGGVATLAELKAWPMDKKLEHLAYMKDTIKSSWEFVSYTFKISGVTRAFTHQFVRTRSNSYAQEAQRVVDLSDAEWTTPELDKQESHTFNESMKNSISAYVTLREMGVAPQDARGVIPTNIHTSIIGMINLRTLSHMAEVRLCTRTQGEYQDVFRLMRAEVLKVHPWAEDFIQVYCVQYGLCCFPRYVECPFHKLTYNGGDEDYHKHMLSSLNSAFWSQRHEASPVAFKDKAKTTDGVGIGAGSKVAYNTGILNGIGVVEKITDFGAAQVMTDKDGLIMAMPGQWEVAQ